MRTIAEFRASKRWNEDLGEALGFDTGRGKVAGWIYADTLYIEDTASWPVDVADAAPPAGKFYLLLDRSEWFSDTIEPLESRLFGWYLSEHLEDTGPIINDALDAACASIQKALGITTGDKAAAHFSGLHRDEFAEVMMGYLLYEALT